MNSKDYPTEYSIFFTGWLYAKFGRQADAMSGLEPAIGGPMALGKIRGELARVYDVVGRVPDAEKPRDQGHRVFPADRALNQSSDQRRGRR